MKTKRTRFGGGCKGVSDIYDDCRCSMFSKTSKISMFSQFSVGAASGVTPTPPVQESRSSMDSSGNRQRVYSTCLRGGNCSDSARSMQHLPHPISQVLEGGVI